jgi:two-component system, cell cycle response regulator DivK
MLTHAGFQVLHEKNGGDGVRVARERLPDVILTDLDMPGVDGLKATQLLKEHYTTAHIPVVAISAHTQSVYRGQAGLAGCDIFLEKPCSPDVLVRSILSLLPT